ncbi:MAG: glycosyltransferase family 39 protein [Candidatus Levybacteria bacterium]|nr:glycosyltransferase family 39 protein [Candidatus Levybacteria bacterium]
MSLLKKYKIETIVLVLLIFLYFLTRFYNILSLPIFTDEAIYIRWAQIAKQDASWRFISLTDGKQPMFVWLTVIAMRFISDPLLAGRLVSVGAGFFTLIGMFFLGREIFRNRLIGLISSGIYVIFPMALVYDKMALYDSLVGTFTIWSLFLTVLLVRRIRLDVALILGMVVGGGVLNKTSGFFNLYLLPLSLILFDWNKKERMQGLVKWVGLISIAVIMTYGFYSILRLSPYFHIIDEKNTIFVYPYREWIEHPLDFFIGNWKALWDWMNLYLTSPLLIASVASFFIARSYAKEKILLFLWFIIPIIALAIFGKTLYPRFIFFMTLSLLPLIAYSLIALYQKVKTRPLFVLFLIMFFFFVFRADFFILTDFENARIPVSDIRQYATDWPSGGGVKEAVEFFQNEAKNQKIYIATQGTFGLMPYAFEIYLIQNPNIAIEGFWPISDTIPQKVLEKSKFMPTYFVFYQPCSSCQETGVAPVVWSQLDLIYQYEKKQPYRYLSLYRVKQ